MTDKQKSDDEMELEIPDWLPQSVPNWVTTKEAAILWFVSERVLLLNSEHQPKHGDGFVTVTLKQFVDCMNEFLGAYDNARLLPTGIVDSLKNAAGRNVVLNMRSNGLLRDVLGLDDRRKNDIRGINLSDQRYTTNLTVRGYKFIIYHPNYPVHASLYPLLYVCCCRNRFRSF